LSKLADEKTSVFGRAWVCVLPWVLVWREQAKASPPESLVFFAKEEQA